MTTLSNFAGLALQKDSHPDTAHVLERPKVLFNVRTRKFVMWMHIDSPDYSTAKLGVAISDSPVGPFSFSHSFRPHGQESRDCTVWKVWHVLLPAPLLQGLDLKQPEAISGFPRGLAI